MIAYWLIRWIGAIARRLPAPVAYALAERTADLTFIFWRRGRANMIDNMTHVIGQDASPKQIRDTARRALRNYLSYLVDFLRAPNLTAADVRERITFDNWEPLEQAQAKGKGTIYIGVHMGNWDMGGALMSLYGLKVNVVADTFPNPKLDEMVVRTREGLGMTIFPYEKAPRRILQALRRNEGVALLMDRPLPLDEGVNITFCGATTAVPGGAATLALRTGASIVSCSMIRLPNEHFIGMVGPCITPNPTGNDKEDVQQLTQEIMAGQEAWIRANPDQWYMFRRMWPKPTTQGQGIRDKGQGVTTEEQGTRNTEHGSAAGQEVAPLRGRSNPE